MNSPCLFKIDRPRLQIILVQTSLFCMCMCTHLEKSGLHKYYKIKDNAFIVDVAIKVEVA